MTFNIKTEGRLISATFEKALKYQVADAVKTETQDALAEIHLRTTQGKDYKEATFEAYSEKYAKRKADGTIFLRKQKGGSQQSRQTNPPDLTLTGKMLGAMRVKIEQAGETARGIISITGTNALKVLGNEANGRKFFEFSEKQLKGIRERILKLLDLNEANK